MIGVEGQYLFKFSIADKTDFLDEGDLISFTLIEECNVLPSFKLEFTTYDQELFFLLNEGNFLQVTFGRDYRDLVNSELMITKKEFQKVGKHKFHVVLVGLYAAPEFLSQNRIKSFSGSSVDVISQVAGNYFKVETNGAKSNDSQVWLQYNIPDKKFINEVWIHSYIPNSFLAIGITSDGRFVMKDVLKEAISKPKWRIVPFDSQNYNEINYNNYQVVSETGFVNQWMGYGKQRKVFNIEDGTWSTISPNLSPVISLSRTLDRTNRISSRVDPITAISDNVHSKYWEAYQRNLAYLALMSSTRVILSFVGEFKPVKVLDLVTFLEGDVTNSASVETYSGLYFVTKVSRTITSKVIATTLELSREALNSLRGDLQ